jgi:hypothetical protein
MIYPIQSIGTIRNKIVNTLIIIAGKGIFCAIFLNIYRTISYTGYTAASADFKVPISFSINRYEMIR